MDDTPKKKEKKVSYYNKRRLIKAHSIVEKRRQQK